MYTAAYPHNWKSKLASNSVIDIIRMDDIRKLKRPLNIGHLGLEADLLWSDPSDVRHHALHFDPYI